MPPQQPNGYHEPLLGAHQSPSDQSINRATSSRQLVSGLRHLTPEQVGQLLLLPAGLGEYCELFVKHKVSGLVLTQLTDGDICELFPVIGDRVTFSSLVLPLKNAHRVQVKNGTILSWKDVVGVWGACRNVLTCTSAWRFRLTPAYLELKRTFFGRHERATVDLADIEDITEEGGCCCANTISCPPLGCGLSRVEICTKDTHHGKIVTTVPKAAAREIFDSVRNAWEQHQNESKWGVERQ